MKQTTRQQRNALKTFLTKSISTGRVYIVESDEWIDASDRAYNALQKLKELFSEEDFVKLEELFKHRNIVDFSLEVSNIYKSNSIDPRSFKRIKG